jgi:hypothetical protein
MIDTLCLYFLGWLVVQTICIIWFYSPFRLSISPFLFGHNGVNTFDEFETLLLIRSSFFGKLLSCYICFSFWTSIIVGIAAIFLINTPYWTCLLTGLTYPAICYLYKSIVE